MASHKGEKAAGTGRRLNSVKKYASGVEKDCFFRMTFPVNNDILKTAGILNENAARAQKFSPGDR